jgi:hypothetical protein
MITKPAKAVFKTMPTAPDIRDHKSFERHAIDQKDRARNDTQAVASHAEEFRHGRARILFGSLTICRVRVSRQFDCDSCQTERAKVKQRRRSARLMYVTTGVFNGDGTVQTRTTPPDMSALTGSDIYPFP